MIASFRSELRKLRARTYAIGIVGMAAFMAVTMLISIGGAGEEPSERGPAGLILSRTELAGADGLGRSLGNGVVFLGIAALTIVAINVGSEFSGGTIRNLLVRQPRRARLLAGKALALLAYTAVAVVAAGVVGIAAALGFAGGNDVDTSAWGTGSGVLATAAGLGNLVVAVAGWACLGLLLGVMLRSAPAAIGVGVAYALPAEILLTETIERAETWLPGQVLQALARGGTPALAHGPALAGAVAWIALATAVAVVVFRSRDLAT